MEPARPGTRGVRRGVRGRPGGRGGAGRGVRGGSGAGGGRGAGPRRVPLVGRHGRHGRRVPWGWSGAVGSAEALAWVDVEWPALLVTVRWAAYRGWVDVVVAVGEGCVPALRVRGAHAVLDEVLSLLVGITAAARHPAVASARAARAEAWAARGLHERAVAEARRAVEDAERVRHPWSVARPWSGPARDASTAPPPPVPGSALPEHCPPSPRRRTATSTPCSGRPAPPSRRTTTRGRARDREAPGRAETGVGGAPLPRRRVDPGGGRRHGPAPPGRGRGAAPRARRPPPRPPDGGRRGGGGHGAAAAGRPGRAAAAARAWPPA